MQTFPVPEEAQAAEILRAWQEQVFWRFGFEGLSMVENPAPVPLVKRCACGRPISATKSTCLACSPKE